MRIPKAALMCALLLGTSGALAGEKDARAWLGVTLSPVPKPLVKQLQLDGTGIMITNVAKNSPAADAGLEQYDVIVEINGEAVPSEYEKFAEQVKAIGVGGKAKLVVIRGGERTKAVVELAEMPEPDEIAYMYEFEEPKVTEFGDELRGRILEKDPSGKWTMRDLGELEGLEDVFENLGDVLGNLEGLEGLKGLECLPHVDGSVSIRIEADDADKHKEARVTHDGKTCEVTIEDDGTITVRHITEEGDLERVTEKSYGSDEELKKADEEAYEVYKQLVKGGRNVIVVTPKGGAAPELKHEWRWEMKKSLEEARRQMKEAEEKTREAQKQAAKEMQKWRFSFRAPHAWKGWPKPPESPEFLYAPAEAKMSFFVDEDGRITVLTRKGDAELKREFKDAKDLKERAPELFEKFTELSESK